VKRNKTGLTRKRNSLTNSTTTTIETLTAQVRVLMVGSRQVTLSVYGQLDTVGHWEIEPFGRVAPRGGHYWRIYVVGGHIETGALVRSQTFSSKGIAELSREGTVWDGKYRVRPNGWSDIEKVRAALAVIAAKWEALPLFVLAGLR
jgi:hypothetical protein